MNHHIHHPHYHPAPDQSLNPSSSATTSPDVSNSIDSGPSSLNSVSYLDQTTSSPVFDVPNGCDYSISYYGFRTRHLSCIEENDSDSFNSLGSDFMEESTNQLNANGAEKTQWESHDFNYVESMIDSCSSGLYQSFKNSIDSETTKRLEFASAILDRTQPGLSGSAASPKAPSPYNELANGLVNNNFTDDVMTNSCYGSLNQSFQSDTPRKTKCEPIYAVIDKEIQQKNQRKKMLEFTASDPSANTTCKDINGAMPGMCSYNADNGCSKDEVDRSVDSDFHDTDISQHYEGLTCPSCHRPFDKDKRRKLIDSCGHERCFSCMFENGKCPFCIENVTNVAPPITSDQMTKSLPIQPEMLQSYESVRICSPDKHYTDISYGPTEAALLNSVTAYKEPWLNPNYGKTKSQPTTPSTTPRKKQFKAKGLRRPFGGGHRRTSSQGSVELPTSLSKECSVMDSSFHSDSAITKCKYSGVTDYNNSGKSNGGNLSRAAYAGHLSSIVFGKIKSLWNAQSSNAGLNQLADVKDETGDGSAEQKVNGAKTPSNGIKDALSPVKSSKKLNQNMLSQRLTSNLRNIKDWSARKSVKPVPPSQAHEKDGSTPETVYHCSQNALQFLALKPLFFEVPLQDPDPPFVGRQWLLRDISNALTSTEMPGVLLIGKAGSGKTSLILQLVDYSCFGRKKGSFQMESGGIYCQINVSHDRIKSLASQVVAYHFCQAENNRTLLVPDFVHSIAAQLCQAPQLTAYREYLLNEAHLQSILSINECIANPEEVMLKGILEPLTLLKGCGKINVKQCFLLIDALCEGETLQPDYGFTISSFLTKMAGHFPVWFKIIATIRNKSVDAVKGIPYMRLTLDNCESNENVQKDIGEYISHRVKHILNPEDSLKLNQEMDLNEAFFENLMVAAKGSFLYVKLILDLIEKSRFTIKSSSLKAMPTSLSQIFLISLNSQFSGSSSFEKVSNILSVCLAALSPLTLSEIYYSIVALNKDEPFEWNEFLKRFKYLENFLVKRIDNTYMFFHPSFREWLMRREDGEPTKYLVDFRKGHYAIAFRLSRLQAPLDCEHTLELAHHILRARVYRCLQPVQHSLRDIQAYWIASASNSLSKAFATLRNVYSPDIKICKLLLLAGADPNVAVDIPERSIILCISAYEGMTSLVSILLEFGADVTRKNKNEETPLILASMQGHLDIVRLLVAAKSRIGQCDNDKNCALVHAAKNGRENVVQYLLSCDWESSPSKAEDTSFNEALRQSLLEAVVKKHLNIIEDLLDSAEVPLNAVDPSSGHTALTKAASLGHSETVSLLLSRGADISQRNHDNLSALLLASRAGHINVVELLLERNADVNDIEPDTVKTPLMIASEEDHLNIVKVLIENGADLERKDSNGLTALCWSCLQGRYYVAKSLLERGANLEAMDNLKRTPLDFASYQAPLRLIQLLLDNGAKVQHADEKGVTPLDRAIASKNAPVLQAFVKAGAVVGPMTWTLAEDEPDILLLLLNNVVKEGNSLLKRHLLSEATQKFRLALNRISTIEHKTSNPEVVTQLLYNLLLSLARCKRKFNDLPEAVHLASRAVSLIPLKYEGYYVRAKVYFVCGDYDKALKDINAALERAGTSSLYIKDILARTKVDIENKDQRETTDL